MKTSVITRGLIVVLVVVVAVIMTFDTVTSAVNTLLDDPWVIMALDTPRTNTMDWAIQWVTENGAHSSEI